MLTKSTISKWLVAFFIGLFLFTGSYQLKAQEVGVIGDCSITFGQRWPTDGLYDYSWSAIIYLESELAAAGIMPGVSIEGLRYFVFNSPVNYTMLDQRIYMKTTTQATFASGDPYPGTSGFDWVFQGDLLWNGTGAYDIMLDNSFAYDGGNIMILFENWDGDWLSGYPTFCAQSTTPDNRVLQRATDNTFPSGVTGLVSVNRPQTGFFYSAAGGPGSETATYTLGDIPTDFNQPSTCPETMTITIPEGDNVIITGVDVAYTMTAASGAWMSEQRSRISILNPGGAAEIDYAQGAGTSAGTFAYERLGLNIGENVVGGGDIIVQMDAYRTWGGAGCNTMYNKVDDGSWTVTIHYDFATEGYIAGVVKDAATDEPIIGAHVMVSGQELLTVAGGAYEFTLSGGEHTIFVHKSGYNTLEQEITIVPNETLMLDLMLMESANVPGAVMAELNAAETAVNITWGLPMGQYEILYDDGIADNVTAWGLGGNMNALRFTPAGYPAKIIGGSVNIFDGTYPPNGNALVPFQMAVYDAGGPNGYPGEELGVVDVTPNDFGWVHFDLEALDITISSGDFYLVMIQGGNFPNCAPIAIDQTAPVMRSYSRFVTGGAPWTPAGFNDFMMRAIVEGPGGPGVLSYGDGELLETGRMSEGALFLNVPKQAVAPVGMGIFKPIPGTGILDRDVIGYHVYRLEEGDEGDEGLWTVVGNPTGTAIVDNSWPGLDDGSYRWAVKARYPLDNFSAPTFSNVLGKNWTSNITITVTLSDPNVSPAGIQVGMTNTEFPQYAYNANTNDDGVVNFPEVWKGNYDVVIYKFGYDLFATNLNVAANSYNLNITLLETTFPPSALYVDPVNIHATWVAPGVSLDLLEENWSSGGFTANEWTFDPAQSNWAVNTFNGNPAPSAQFNWSPSITNYNFALVSKQLSGLGMPNVMFKYDIFLNNFSSATLEQMTVEVWNGSTWAQVANHTNAGGSIPWTTYTFDITDHALGQQFKVRFRAHGENSFNLNNWNVDNIMIYGEVADGSNRGVLGYFVYLDDVVAGFTEETSFQYQPDYINYGQTYTAGVQAVYESGISDMITYVFTSQFLYPPCNLEGEDIGHAVSLTWDAPGLCDPFGGSGGGGGGGTGQLYEISYHNGIPVDGFFQSFNMAYGVVYNLAGYSNVTVEMADFRHSPWGVFGTWSYKLHVVDWNTHTLLYSTPVQQTTINNGWELEIPLNSIPQSGLVGIFMEPMGNVANDAYPCIDGDQQFTTSSFYGTIPNWSGMSSANPVGNFLMDLWIMADPMDGGERQLVQAPVLEGAPAENIKSRNAGTVQVSQPSHMPASMDPNHVPVPVKPNNRFNMNTSLRSDVGYGWNAFAGASGVPTGSVSIALPAGTLTLIQAVPDATIWMAGGDWANGVWYTVSYSAANNSGFYTVDHVTGDYTLIGNTGFGMTGLAFDVTTQIMYASGFDGANSNLYTIDMATGQATLVGQISTGIIIAIAADAQGNMFGTHLNTDALWSINKETGAGTQVGPLGVTINFAQDLGFDRDNDILYGTLYTTSGGLYTINTATGQATMLNNFIAEVCAFGVPYTAGGPGGGPVATDGFRIYRNGTMIAEVDGETFSFVDDDGDYLKAGTYSYSVTAIYEFGEEIVESLHEGPVSVTVAPGFGFVQGIVFDAVTFQPIGGVEVTAGEFSTTTQANGTYSLVAYEGVYDIHFDKIGYALFVEEGFEVVWQQTHTLNAELTPQDPNFPFEENWSSGSFATQGWTFVPAQGNWRISTTAGNPAPSAEFNWSPSVTNYSFALTSVEIDARAAMQNVTLSYSIFLDNWTATSGEKMTVEIWNGEEWVFVAEYKNDSDIPWATHHHDVTEHAAGKMTRIRFVANGANSFNINWWYLDNIMLHEVLPPAISVTPSELFQALQVGQTATQQLTVANIGDGAMNFTTQVEYLDKGDFTIYPVPGGEKVVVSDMDVSSAPSYIPGGEPEAPHRNEVILNYDGPNNDAIGLTAGGTFHVAARFPSAMVGQYAGYALTSVDVYINDVPSAANLKIWGAGTGTTPGAILHQQTFTSTPNSWINVQLSSPVILDGTDIWVGYEVTHGASQFPAGCDAGPANPNGDWISIDGVVWEHLAGFGLNYNWNIRAKLNPGEGLWLSVSPNSGSVAPGGSQALTVEFDAAGLEIREYNANIKVNSNDPNNPTVIVPVTLDVLVGIDELEREAVMVYPVPASEVLFVATSQGIRNVRMFSYTGQMVYESNVPGETTLNIDVTPFHTGAYILQFITKDGQTFNRRILINR